jgi:hypothetical protein
MSVGKNLREYKICCKCGSEKELNTVRFCKPCRRKYAKETCKCGNLKKFKSAPYCEECWSIRNKKVKSELINKKLIPIKEQLIEYFNGLERRNYLCNEIDFYIIAHYWVELFDDKITRYDGLSFVTQIKKMLNDLKNIYIECQKNENFEGVNKS